MINYLHEEIQKFSESKFCKREGIDAKGPLNHLKEEIDELLEILGEDNKDEENEWADCLLLLLDSFRIRYGNNVSYNRFLHFCLNKLEIINKRQYETVPNKNGVYHHIKNNINKK